MWIIHTGRCRHITHRLNHQLEILQLHNSLKKSVEILSFNGVARIRGQWSTNMFFLVHFKEIRLFGEKIFSFFHFVWRRSLHSLSVLKFFQLFCVFCQVKFIFPFLNDLFCKNKSFFQFPLIQEKFGECFDSNEGKNWIWNNFEN